MLTVVHPKLPMRDKTATKAFYVGKLGFHQLGSTDYDDYLMLENGPVQIHFFLFKELDPKQNYGQVYIRTNDINGLYHQYLTNQTPIHPQGHLEIKPWGQKEFSLLDPDNNLLTFGETVK